MRPTLQTVTVGLQIGIERLGRPQAAAASLKGLAEAILGEEPDPIESEPTQRGEGNDV